MFSSEEMNMMMMVITNKMAALDVEISPEERGAATAAIVAVYASMIKHYIDLSNEILGKHDVPDDSWILYPDIEIIINGAIKYFTRIAKGVVEGRTFDRQFLEQLGIVWDEDEEEVD